MALMTEQQETMFVEPQDLLPSDVFPSDVHPSYSEETHSVALELEPGPRLDQEPAEPFAEAEQPAEAMQAYDPEAAVWHSEVSAEATATQAPLPILTADDFSGLEERVLRAVSLVRREREARIAAEDRIVVLEAHVAGLQLEAAAVERMQEEMDALRAEREQVRVRVERLLGQLDALEF